MGRHACPLARKPLDTQYDNPDYRSKTIYKQYLRYEFIGGKPITQYLKNVLNSTHCPELLKDPFFAKMSLKNSQR
jgi:hypothetical protein